MWEQVSRGEERNEEMTIPAQGEERHGRGRRKLLDPRGRSLDPVCIQAKLLEGSTLCLKKQVETNLIKKKTSIVRVTHKEAGKNISRKVISKKVFAGESQSVQGCVTHGSGL